MLKNFTKEYIITNRGCYTEEQVEKLSFINEENISLCSILNSEIPTKDKLYFVLFNCELNHSYRRSLIKKFTENSTPFLIFCDYGKINGETALKIIKDFVKQFN